MFAPVSQTHLTSHTQHNPTLYGSLSPASPLLPPESPGLTTNTTGQHFLILKIFLFFLVIRLESTSIIILNKEIEIEGRRDKAGGPRHDNYKININIR